MQSVLHPSQREDASNGPPLLIRVLVVDGEPALRRPLAERLSGHYDVESCGSAEAAYDLLDTFRPDVVLTTLRLPGASGLDLVRGVRARCSECLVFVLSTLPSIDAAVAAIRSGANDFMARPLEAGQLEARLAREVESRRGALLLKHQREMGLTTSRALCAPGSALEPVLELAWDVATTSATVLITGESGTGKEVLARFIHQRSGRSGPFVAVNCGAIPPELMESELFGHEEGAFTGALHRTAGRFERARGGTILLDEIGDLPLLMQVKLLRVLQEHQFERVGGSEPVEVDLRVIAATNRDLAVEVEEGRFREDLFYRLDVISLHCPPLRERKADIGVLWPRFVERFARRERLRPPATSSEALTSLVAHAWPGNVRELENVAERAVILSRGETIERRHLPASVCASTDAAAFAARDVTAPGASLEDIEKQAILRTLGATGGNTQRAADILGISARKIQYRLRQWRAERDPE